MKSYRILIVVFCSVFSLTMVAASLAFAGNTPAPPTIPQHAPTPTHLTTGGPDAFGYTFADSYEAECNVPFIDISGSGFSLGLSRTGTVDLIIPFLFEFYGITSDDIRVSNNGGILFNSSFNFIPDPNAPLPTDSGGVGTFPAMLPFWDDLDSTTGDVYYQTVGVAPNRRFIVQWHQRSHYSSLPVGDATFQLVLDESTYEVYFVYNDVNFDTATYDGGASATIGIEQNSSNALQYSFNTAAITDGMSICFFPPTGPAIELTKTVGTNPAGCASTDFINVPSGEKVFYCYTVTNTGDVTLTQHDLVDTELGTILSGAPVVLPPGATFAITQSATIFTDTTNVATWTGYNLGPTDVASSTYTATVRIAENSPVTCNGAVVDFNRGIPLDWSVVITGANTDIFWTDLIGCGESDNFTGGTGDVACASSDLQGGGGGLYGTQLRTPLIDLTSGYTSVQLDYIANYQNIGFDYLNLDISNDAGTSWTNLLSWHEDHPAFGGLRLIAGEAVSLDLTPYSGQEVMLRWHYYDPAGGIGSPDWYAQVDDVALTCNTGPQVTLDVTVGTDPSSCATTNNITVASGDTVTFCYEVTNTGTVTFTRHDLDDLVNGTILNNFVQTLAPGDSIVLTRSATIVATTVNTATWSATNTGPGGGSDMDSDSATVYVLGLETCGPDSYGYTCINSIAPECSPTFTDISGINPGLGLGDEAAINLTLPFPFTFYGVSSTDIRVSNNGGILFNTTFGDAFAGNLALPTTSGGFSNLTILPFWDDIDSDTGDVYTATLGIAPNRRFIIQWENRPHFSNIGSTTFQVVLYEGTNDIDFIYDDVLFENSSFDNGASATVGIQQNSSNALQYSFNAPIVTDGLAICYSPPVDEVIDLQKTVGTDPSVCATTDTITVPTGSTVYYCYQVTNATSLARRRHDLVDNELGTLLTGFSLTLDPGMSTFITASAVLTTTTVNTATWTMYNPAGGGSDIISDTDTATVFVNTNDPLTCNEGVVGFDAGIPLDWSVIAGTNNPDIFWTDIDACGESGNFTDGVGNAACASSEFQAIDGGFYDTQLRSNPFDLTDSTQTAITLTYNANYQNFFNDDVLDLDISTDGGFNWTNLLRWNEDHGVFRSPDGETVTVDLSAYHGFTGLILRWHYYDPVGDLISEDFYAQIDDVSLTCAVSTCSAPDIPASIGIAVTGTNGIELNWTDTGDSLYEIWWASNDPYFTVGDAGTFSDTLTGPFGASIIWVDVMGAGDISNNYTYIIANSCGEAGITGTFIRKGEFDFVIVPGT